MVQLLVKVQAWAVKAANAQGQLEYEIAQWQSATCHKSLGSNHAHGAPPIIGSVSSSQLSWPETKLHLLRGGALILTLWCSMLSANG